MAAFSNHRFGSRYGFSVKGALAGTGQVTIWLNKATSGDVTVAYFVLSAP